MTLHAQICTFQDTARENICKVFHTKKTESKRANIPGDHLFSLSPHPLHQGVRIVDLSLNFAYTLKGSFPVSLVN